ncbi:MAG: xylulokinase [Planctomycetes bacterium]|jgi:D-xylulose kinase|nr:xylulokinase [Planctomycetota bacterium]
MSQAGSLYLGFDVGTQSTKALVIDAVRHTVVARGASPHTLLPGLPPGHLEQHPRQWLEAVLAAGRQALAEVDPARIAGIAVSGQQHGCVVLDAEHEVVRPAKLWCDTATAAEANELSERLGRAVPTGFTASKVAWLCRHEPANWARVRTVLLPHDYVNWWLTGELSMEFGDASGTGWFDPVTRTFDAAAMAAIDPSLASRLPPLRQSGALAGRLTAAAAQALGLRPGVPIGPGGGDNMMAAIGSGATAAGVVTASLGTSGTIFARTESPVQDPAGAIAPFCSSDGAWLPLLCVMNVTGVTEEVKLLTGLDHAALTAAAAAVPIGADGLLWLPFLLGERVPDLPTATGSLLGLRPGLLRPGHLYRAALEGTSLNLAQGLDRLRELGLLVDEVRLCGGASHNVLWRQILADLFGVPVRPLLESESAALGAAVQALWAVQRAAGERELTSDAVAQPFVALGAPVAPQPRWRPAHQALRVRYAEALARLHPTAR